jgi:hypothetical protein
MREPHSQQSQALELPVHALDRERGERDPIAYESFLELSRREVLIRLE